MPIECLTHEQICELTGAKLKKSQIQNLQHNGIRHSIKASGWPCVTVAAVEGWLPDTSPEPERPVWVPDLSKVR